MKKKMIMALFIVATLGLTGCSDELIPMDTKTDMLSGFEPTTTEVVDESGEKLEEKSLTQVLPIEDEDFSLVCSYDVGDYDISHWRVTDSKSISMKVTTQNLPDGYDVHLDHVHAEISLKSTSAAFNGIEQGTMDDTYHGTSQDGFYINNDVSYYNIFAINGYTDKFFQSFGYAYNEIGASSGNTKRLTEKCIVKNGTYAEKLSVVYDVSIKKPGIDQYYTKSVISNILIPVSQDLK